MTLEHRPSIVDLRVCQFSNTTLSYRRISQIGNHRLQILSLRPSPMLSHLYIHSLTLVHFCSNSRDCLSARCIAFASHEYLMQIKKKHYCNYRKHKIIISSKQIHLHNDVKLFGHEITLIIINLWILSLFRIASILRICYLFHMCDYQMSDISNE